MTAVSTDAALDDLIADIEALGPGGDGTLNQGQEHALTRKPEQAQALFDKGKTDEALDVLSGFRQQALDLEADGVLSPEQRAALVARADAITDVLEAP